MIGSEIAAFSYTVMCPTYIYLRVLGMKMISHALSVSVIYNDRILQFYYQGLSPTLEGGDYSILDGVR